MAKQVLGSGPKLIEGGFVRLPGSLGFGKLESFARGQATVSLFFSVGHRERRSYEVAEIARAYLYPETRAYVFHNERWSMGRVKDYANDGRFIEYALQFPNGKIAYFVETEIDVRCWTAAEDPVLVLTAGAGESQYLHDRRRACSDRIVATLAAAQGMSALLSSAIDLVPHQVAAVRRVLSDPLQRYLLADEVGMGKTIEAGIIIRQCLIDDPTRRVLVIVPPTLLSQWRDELKNKFRSGDFGEAIELSSHADADYRFIPDLLVIDEAHRIVNDDRIRLLAHAAPRLLLLSATPVLGDEATFLAVLNLLDPDVNKLDDREAFHDRVVQQQSFGRLLLGLQPDAPAFVLKTRLSEALTRFAEDDVVHAFVARARASLERGDDVELEVSCRELQFHIADTYRIHQRVIRSRRRDASDSHFGQRGNGGTQLDAGYARSVRVEVDEDARYFDVAVALEDWREIALAATNDGLIHDRLVIARWFLRLLEAAGRSVDALVDCAHTAMDANVPGADGLVTAMQELVTREWGGTSREDLASQSLLIMRRSIAQNGHILPKIVVFFTEPKDARRLYDRLSPTEAILLGEAPESVERFAQDPHVWVLIADATGEEGLNLHFAHGILHGDLPFSAARIEQRVGRLDRYGRCLPNIAQRVVLPYDEDGSIWAAWYELLAGGFQVFDRSISDVQFVLSKLEDEISLAAFARGATGIIDSISAVRARLASERERQDEQYVLDRVALAEESAEEVVRRTAAIDADEEGLERDMEGWIVKVMGIVRQPAEWPASDPFRLRWTEGTRVPKEPWQTEFGPDLDRPLTWRRDVAAQTNGASLLRQGTPLVDACERYMRWDDRGSAFATWRVEPGWGSADDWTLAFRLCFIIEPRITEDDAILDRSSANGIGRRAQAFLPPWTQTLHVDGPGNAIADEKFLKVLERPYDKERSRDGRFDVNLCSRPEIRDDVLDPAELARLCASIRSNAVAVLTNNPSFITRVKDATLRVRTYVERTNRRLARRLAIDPNGRDALRVELRANELVVAAVEQPRIRLDAFGLFVVAGEGPRERE